MSMCAIVCRCCDEIIELFDDKRVKASDMLKHTDSICKDCKNKNKTERDFLRYKI